MSDRKVFLEGKIAELKAEKETGISMNRSEEIARDLQAFETELQQAITEEQQAAAHKVVIQEATEKAAYIMDNLVIEGLTVRELALGEKEYQLLKIGVQGEFIAQAESANIAKQLVELAYKAASDRELQLKRQNDELQSNLENARKMHMSLDEQLNDLESRVNHLTIERDDALSKRDAAVAEKEGLELMLQTKQEEIELMRVENAVGAQKAPYVIDMEARRDEMKELADQIKASRIHVYDVVPDNEINPKNYTAKRADTGAEVTYNWTQTRNYIEIKDAAEVERFRQQFVNQEVVSDSPLGNEETPNVAPEVPFPTLPSAIAPEAILPPEVQLVISAPTDGGQGQTVEERVAALEKRVVELEKVCNLNEEAA